MFSTVCSLKQTPFWWIAQGLKWHLIAFLAACAKILIGLFLEDRIDGFSTEHAWETIEPLTHDFMHKINYLLFKMKSLGFYLAKCINHSPSFQEFVSAVEQSEE